MTDVLVDMDDVFYPWSAKAHELCERAGITNGRKISSWHFWVDYGCEEREVWDVLESGTISGELYEAAPIPGTLAQLRRLRNYGHRAHVVTARGFGKTGDLVQALTREWVRIWNVPLDSLTFAKNKAKAAYELGTTLAVDDGPHNYDDLTSAGVTTYLMDAKHNQTFPAPRRVRSLKEFVDVAVSVGGV